MAESSQGILVGQTETEVFIRVTGRGSFQNSQPLRRYALEMLDKGFKRFVVDLGPCAGMDSTFLGVLAGLGLRLRNHNGAGSIQIINASSRNKELLQTLGLDRLFEMEGEAERVTTPPLSSLSGTKLGERSDGSDKLDTAEMMLEAHDNLIKADDRNAPKFKDVTKFLREEIEKNKQESS